MTLLDNCFKPIIGLPCWGVRQGHGSFLELNFGNPQLEVRDITRSRDGKRVSRRLARVKGDWTLLLWCCNWKLNFTDRAGVHSESRRKDINLALTDLTGQRLMAVKINKKKATSEFLFDLGASLTTSVYDSSVSREEGLFDCWMFYQGNAVLTFNEEGKLQYTQSNAPINDPS